MHQYGVQPILEVWKWSSGMHPEYRGISLRYPVYEETRFCIAPILYTYTTKIQKGLIDHTIQVFDPENIPSLVK